MQATPKEFSRATCCITIDGEHICRWRWMRQTHGLCNHQSRARWSNFRMSVVCIAITSEWRHDTREPSVQRYEFSGRITIRQRCEVRPGVREQALTYATMQRTVGDTLNGRK